MYYIINDDLLFYAGKCCSDNKTEVWKYHNSRALGFNTREDAEGYLKVDPVHYVGLLYIKED